MFFAGIHRIMGKTVMAIFSKIVILKAYAKTKLIIKSIIPGIKKSGKINVV
jgi:hypothetical protein